MRRYRVFVSIPEGPEFRALYKRAIKPIHEGNLELICYFESPQTGAFERTIRRNIAYSNLVIAVLSGSNPNVLYEVGLSRGYGKPVIFLTDSIAQLPTMVGHRDAITYKRGEKRWRTIPSELRKRCDQLLHGVYVPLRIRTHTELLLRQRDPSCKNHRTPSRRGADLLEGAILAYEQKAYEDVVRSLTPSILRESSENAFFYLCDSHFLLAENLPESGVKHAHYQKMLEVAEQGHRLFPTHRDLLKNLGLAHLKLRHLDLAEQIFVELIQKHPTYEVARYDLACVHAQRGQLFPCLEQLMAVIEQDDAWRFLARVDPDFDPLWYSDLFQRLLFSIEPD